MYASQTEDTLHSLDVLMSVCLFMFVSVSIYHNH